MIFYMDKLVGQLLAGAPHNLAIDTDHRSPELFAVQLALRNEERPNEIQVVLVLGFDRPRSALHEPAVVEKLCQPGRRRGPRGARAP